MGNSTPDSLRASVVIPTFNGAARFPRVLAALAEQTAPDGSFEVLVVDNASTDNTAEVAERDPSTQRLRNRGCEVRVVAEPHQGLTHARIAGIKGARAAAICFLDDDNVPDRDYIENGIALFDEPSLGLAVANVRPLWETQPSPSVERRKHLLALNDYMGDQTREFGAVAVAAPTIGAGMWVRRDAYLKAIPCDRPDLLMAGRVGSQLVGGEDIEIGYLIGKAGYQRIYAPALKVSHRIPRGRLETAYLIRLIEAIIRGELTLREKYEGKRFRFRDRVIALVRLAGVFCAIPALLMIRRDGRREILFVIAARRAYLKGPIKAV